MMKELVIVLLALTFIAFLSAGFSVYADQTPKDPVVNQFFCPPSVVVVCRHRDGEMICDEFGSRKEAEDHYATE